MKDFIYQNKINLFAPKNNRLSNRLAPTGFNNAVEVYTGDYLPHGRSKSAGFYVIPCSNEHGLFRNGNEIYRKPRRSGFRLDYPLRHRSEHPSARQPSTPVGTFPQETGITQANTQRGRRASRFIATHA